MFRQLAEVTLVNLRQVPFRLGTSVVIVVGIGGVAGVLIALLAMAAGLQATLSRTGAPDRAIVLRAGADSESASRIGIDEVNILATLPSVAALSAELHVATDVPKRGDGEEANVVVRGVGPEAWAIRDEVRLVRGRMFVPGRAEVVAGRGAHLEFEGIDVGGTVRVRDAAWTVVGIFEADGSAYESELWADLPVVRTAFRREGGVSSLRIRLAAADRLDELASRVAQDPRLNLSVESERAHFARQSAGLTRTIETFGRAVAIVMALGAALAALNAMHAAVSARAVEIATLRALGFGTVPGVGSVLVESLALAAVGGLLGAAAAYLGFDGFTASEHNEDAFSQVAFDFAVTSGLIGEGMLWAMILGAVGGLFPALRAVRAPIATALRGLPT